MKELASVDTRRITDLQCASYLSTKQIPFTTERDHQDNVIFSHGMGLKFGRKRVNLMPFPPPPLR